MSNKETEILGVLTEAYPDLDAGPGTPFYELVVRPMSYLWARHEEGYAGMTDSFFLSNYATMSEADLDRLVSNFYITRKTGSYVYGTVRVVLSDMKDYYIQQGFSFLKGTLGYTALTDTYISKLDLSGDATNGYYVDVSIVSDGTSNTYNLYESDALTTKESISPYIKRIYVVENSTDGGVAEDNTELFNRVARSLSLKNLTTYRGISATLYDMFNLKAVLPVGLRDPELRRDLIDLDPIGPVHRGGMADIYVKSEPYYIANGYTTPLGFPYSYNGMSITSNPDALMASWNALAFPSIDVYTRGSMLESIEGLSAATDMSSVTSNISAVHEYCYNSEFEALHSDNLVKEMWPLIIKVHIKIPASGAITYVNGVASDGTDQVAVAKKAIVDYISDLSISQAPNISKIVSCVIAAGVESVVLPLTELKCYYITENLTMQWFGINGARSTTTSLLKPTSDDSLAFVIDDDTQISNRNCTWYTNTDLITVEVV